MNLKTPTATLVLGSIALLVIAVLGWFVVIGPATGRLAEAQESLANVEDANQASQAKLAQLRQAEEDLPATRETAADLTEVFPATAEQATFFETVNAAARAAGINPGAVVDVSPSIPAPGADDAVDPEEVEPGEPLEADMAMQTVSISVDAGYDEITRMLANLADADRAVFITSVSISGDNYGAMNLSLTATTFVAPPLIDPSTEDDADTGDAQ